MDKFLLVFAAKYRYSQLNSCLRYFKSGNMIIFSTKSYFVFKFLFFFFKNKTVPIFCDGKTIKGKYKKFYHLWFNTVNEIENDRIKDDKDLFLCLDPKKENNLFLLTPKLKTSFILKLNSNSKIIYISEVNIKVNSNVDKFWLKNRDEILQSLDLINDVSYLKDIFFDGNEQGYINYMQLKNLLRYELINLVNKYFKKNLFLVGKDWKNLGFNSKVVQYNTNFRKKSYVNSICLDFGAKSGSNSLYPRTIEILENKGYLLQAQQIDSAIIKKDIPDNYDTFKSSNELLEKLNSLLKSHKEIKINNYNNLSNKFTNFLKKI